MTERLYYNDSFLTGFDATVVEVADAGRRVYLDRTAFYPGSGGQPADTGLLAGLRVVDVVDEEERIAHLLEAPLAAAPGSRVRGEIDAARRLDHAQQHTGQHLLSAVLLDLFGAPTLSFHMGAEASTIELGIDALDAGQLAQAERAANRIAAENRPVRVSYEEAGSPEGLRKTSARRGALRIVTIDGLDRSACGGTHLRTTGEIGAILLRRTERIRGHVRLEFVCGLRAVDRARRDYEALQSAARQISVGIDELPQSLAALVERLTESEKARRKLAGEAASYRGRELYAATPAQAGGLRRRLRQAAKLDEEVRLEAQSFTAAPRAVFLAWCPDPPSLLLACSPDAGLHAGNTLKPLLAACGGRGGGSAVMAQGSVPRRADLDAIVEKLSA